MSWVVIKPVRFFFWTRPNNKGVVHSLQIFKRMKPQIQEGLAGCTDALVHADVIYYRDKVLLKISESMLLMQ